LQAGIQVVIYAGDCGFICNWLGNQAWTLDLQWAGQAGFNAASMQPWSVAGEPAGEVRSYELLSFVRVFNAGHMAPSDVPQPMQVLFNSFIAGQPLV
jgi:cathepsin A (carboxypeptidase C)